MIVGGRIVSVKAEKLKDEQMKGLSVNVSVESIAPDANMVKVSYTYSINYNDKVAKMEIKGDLFVQPDSDMGRKITAGWNKNRNMPPDCAEEILSAISYAGSSVGTLLAFSLGIQAPINMPRAKLAPADLSPKAG